MKSAFALALLSLAFRAAAAEPVVVLEDPRGDDDGPGGYQYPTGSDYHPGDFDLRRLEISVDGKYAVISVTLGARIQKPSMVRRSMATEVELTNNVYVQNVDLYIDNVPGAGFTETLPGRNVTLDPDGAWDVAVVLTPQPFLTRSIIDGALPKGAPDRVHVATDLRAEGPKLVARVPLAELGGIPRASWGFQVLVTGATWDPSFAAVDRLVGSYEPNAFTMPVYAVPEPMAFGGGAIDRFQPRVIDLFAPPGRSQHDILGGFSQEKERRARVPMIYPDPAGQERARQATRAAAGPRELPKLGVGLDVPTSTRAPRRPAEEVYRIGDVDGNKAVIALPPGGSLALWRMGTVVDERGQTVARVVVTAAFPSFVMATAVEGEKGLRRGLEVRFAPSTETSSNKPPTKSP